MSQNEEQIIIIDKKQEALKLKIFLIKENVYDKFLANGGNTDDIDISVSFTWSETPEGHSFWFKLYYKFIDNKYKIDCNLTEGGELL